jgi:hypothetical protein
MLDELIVEVKFDSSKLQSALTALSDKLKTYVPQDLQERVCEDVAETIGSTIKIEDKS